MISQNEEFLGIFNTIEFDRIKDHPNILIAARFWDQDRYKAAEVLYKFMRNIDDMIDNYKAAHKMIAPSERKTFVDNVNEWMKTLIDSENHDPFQKELIQTMDRFCIPLWPLEAFARSMIYDIHNDGFPTLESYLDYSRGASVAPASIFVHLNGLTIKDGKYEPPAFNVKEAATPCAIFSYLVHIIRDFQKDQLNNLNYFADDMIAKHRLTRHDLREIAWEHPVSSNFRNLINEYYSLADKYRLMTYEIIRKISPLLEPRYKLSLEIIFTLYLMVFERIDVKNGNFRTEELNPTPEETKDRVYKTIAKFNT
ncbi:MAG: squalene/phytoene synthase family protein [Bacteroidia bacterium]|nr:squalene/phytoene synthase family protein [Bacteroidia bacterium]